MTRWQLIKQMSTVARRLRRELIHKGDWRGSPKTRFLAAIRQYWATNRCTQCETHPELSCSHRVYNTVERYGFTIAITLLLWGSVGPRDDYGWRRGGV
jgi:hypothetical protein